MKSRHLVLLVIFLLAVIYQNPIRVRAAETVPINKSVFKDSHMRELLASDFDKNKDGRFSKQELKKVTNITIRYGSSATGLLQAIDFSGLEKLKYLQEIVIDGVKASKLNLVNTKHLKEIHIFNSTITNVRIQGNKKLTNIICKKSNIMKFTVKNNKKLTEFEMSDGTTSYDNKIASLVLCGSPLLEVVHLRESELKSLDINLKNLNNMDVSDNLLQELDMTKCKKIVRLSCSYNKLKKLKLSNPNLYILECGHNLLREIPYVGSEKLRELSVGGNKLHSLDISRYRKLEKLNCEDNFLWEMDLKKCKNLSELCCSDNQLENLLLTGKKLVKVDCSQNSLTKISGSGRKKLKYLYARRNCLSSINLKDYPNLQELHLECNKLQKIDFPARTVPINELYVQGNPLLKQVICRYRTAAADRKYSLIRCDEKLEVLTQAPADFEFNIFRGAPEYIEEEELDDNIVHGRINLPPAKKPADINPYSLKDVLIRNKLNRYIRANQVVRATDLKVDFFYYPYGKETRSEVNDLTGMEQFYNLKNLRFYQMNAVNTQVLNTLDLESIILHNSKWENFSTASFKNLKELALVNVNVEKLDLSKNPKLKYLDVSHCNIQSLDLSKNPNLEELVIRDTQLKNIKLNHKKLKSLEIRRTPIKKVDIRKCPKLKKISCDKSILVKRKIEHGF